MRRRIFYGFQPINEEINKKNQKSLIWALPMIYLVIVLIYVFINKEIFSIEKIYINSSTDLKYISYAILFIPLIFYVVYIFSFLFKKTQDFRTNLFRYIIMFIQYILLLPVILLSVSNNSLLILISCFSYISLFFITPILK